MYRGIHRVVGLTPDLINDGDRRRRKRNPVASPPPRDSLEREREDGGGRGGGGGGGGGRTETGEKICCDSFSKTRVSPIRQY